MSPKPRKPKKPSLLELSNIPEDPSTASPDRELCQKCGLYLTATQPFQRTPRNPDWNQRLLVVGESVGQEKDSHDKFFVGRAGQLLLSECDTAGYSPEDVDVCAPLLCRSSNNKAPSVDQIRCCRPFLIWEVINRQPKVVMGVGVTAARALTNDGAASLIKTRGRLLSIPVSETKEGPSDTV